MNIRKSVAKRVENEWIRNNWERTPYNVLGVRHTALVFLIWCLRGRASAIAYLFHPGQKHYHSYMSHNLIPLSLGIQPSNSVGMHTRMRRYHSFISSDLIMLKLQHINLRWWKVPIPPGHVIFDYVISW